MAQLLISPKIQFTDDNGDPLAGGKLYSYAAGTSTPLATYQDKDQSTANTNPVVLDSRGEASVWLTSSAYKLILKDSSDNTIWTVDGVSSIQDLSVDSLQLADGAVTTAKIADEAVTRDKLSTGVFGYADSEVVTEDITININDELVIVNAVAGSVTVLLPNASAAEGKVIKVKRIDDPSILTDTFVDGNVTLDTNLIAASGHPFSNTQKVRLTSSGTLPSGLSLATDYYIIYVDANNIKFASSKANAEVGTAVDITAAGGGGTHTITSQPSTVTVDAYLNETIDNELTKLLPQRYAYLEMYCSGAEWYILNSSEFVNNTGFLFPGLIMPMHTYNGTLTREQGWMKCDGRQVTEANYNTEHGAGSWDVYIGSSPIENLYLPDLTGSKYLSGVASTTQSGSVAITEVGNASNQINLQHSHTVNAHNHKWFDDDSSATDNSFDVSGNSINITSGGGPSTGLMATAGTSGGGFLQGDWYTENASPGSDNQLSTTQSIQPRSVEVVYYMRIV